MKRVMWIEDKDGGLAGPARIGWVEVKNRGKKLVYGDQVFLSLRGAGFKTNFYDRDTKREYWISGCHKDGRDALYGTTAEVDEDALEEYWVNIRKLPDKVRVKKFQAKSKY